MSNGRAHRRRVSRQRVYVGTFCGVAAHSRDVELTKKITHDQLIRQMGESRRSGVRWLVIESTDPHARAVLDTMDDGYEHREWDASLRERLDADERVALLDERDLSGLRRKLDELPDSVLVVAMADGVR